MRTMLSTFHWRYWDTYKNSIMHIIQLHASKVEHIDLGDEFEVDVERRNIRAAFEVRIPVMQVPAGIVTLFRFITISYNVYLL